MSKAYIFGACVGAIVVLSVFLIKGACKGDGARTILDERQERARGIGYKYGFFTFLFLDAVVALLAPFIDILADNIMIVVCGVVIMSVSVCGVYFIVHDAYIGLNTNPRRTMLTLAALGLLNAAIVVFEVIHGSPFISNGKIATWVENLLCAVMLFFAEGVYFFHQKNVSKEED